MTHVRERKKEFDECYLGHYKQWFIGFLHYWCLCGCVMYRMMITQGCTNKNQLTLRTSSLNSVGYFCIFPEIIFKQNMIYNSDNSVINDEIESFFAEYILVLYFLSNWHLSIANFFSLSAKK